MFTGVHPTDKHTLNHIERFGQIPDEVREGTHPRFLEQAAGRLTVQRLRVFPLAGQAGYDPRTLRANLQWMSFYADHGEEARVVTLTEGLTSRLRLTCADSSLVTGYFEGLALQISQNSFWSSRPTGSDEPTMVGMMSYNRDGPLPVEAMTWPDTPHEVVDYVQFWHRIFENAAPIALDEPAIP